MAPALACLAALRNASNGSTASNWNSLSTLRRIMVRVAFESFTQAFNAWAHEQFARAPGEQLTTVRLWRSEALGKGVKASMRDCDQSY